MSLKTVRATLNHVLLHRKEIEYGVTANITAFQTESVHHIAVARGSIPRTRI